ncbi:TolC family protein [Brucepastera parasyntrophica]|uniref:TolC family protein n=1 Tax=Brucepastera parasyntrophica TaxID=2880008 RepID=UPI002109E339|nr:TolC family protein [Brucepastera parasyntrophica]ULQ60867.1 TolC family protein [Brucepastera parasyntrophica]
MKRKQKKWILIAAVFFCIIPAVSAQTVLSVEEAVRLGLENNLSLERTKLETDQKKRESNRSWNGLIPSVSASASASHATTLIGDPSPASIDEWIPGFSLSASMTLTTSIFTNIEQARLQYQAGLISYETARQTLELQVRKAFYQLLLLEANISLTEQSIGTAQSRYDQTAALARHGQASALEELSARVDLENMKPTLRTVQSGYNNALESFKQVIGIPLDEEITLAGSLDDTISFINTENIQKNGESASVTSLRMSLEIIEAQLKAAKLQAYTPSVSVSWNTSPSYSNSTWSDSGSFTARLTFSLDSLLPWSATKTQIDSLKTSVAIYQSNLAEAKMNSDLQVRQLVRTIEQSLETIEALKLNVDLAEQSYAMYEESYQKGTTDLQNLRSAADSLSTAQNRVQEELYNLLSATLDLENELNVPFGTLGRI